MERGFAIYEMPVGWMRVEHENGNITRLGKIADEPEDKGSRTALTDVVDRQLREYFDGKRKEFDFPYEMKGTVFQKACGGLFVPFLMAKPGRIRTLPLRWATPRPAVPWVWPITKTPLPLWCLVIV